jgi:photosystem II stability/assembly factor-like uncharacterized protein
MIMKNASCNAVSHHTFRGLLTKKSVLPLLIITALTAALFAPPTATFASSNLRERSGLFPTIGLAPTSSKRSPKPTTQLIAIHMLDKTHGWALTDTSVLKTSDGGLHWNVVTPPNVPVPPGPQGTSISRHVSWESGTFMSQNVAWVVGVIDVPSSPLGPEQFFTEQTTDGGSHWQPSQLSGLFGPTGILSDVPHFINMQEGWLDFPDRDDSFLFHTTDGGQHWSKLATTGRGVGHIDTGISVKDAQNIWQTVAPHLSVGLPTAIPNVPIAFVTHDGGKTWQQQTLPPIPGSGSQHYITTPPVFFGNDGLMPVEVTSSNFENTGLSIYVTNDGGRHWSSGAEIHWSSSAQISLPFLEAIRRVSILNQQHIWVESSDGSGSIYESQDGGKSWNRLGTIGNQFSIVDVMSFPDTNNGWVIPGPLALYYGGSQLLHTTDGGRTWQPIAYSIQ